MANQDATPDLPAHTPGTPKGEERFSRHGREAGRENKEGCMARDATSINPESHDPIDPKMPHLPPP
jgi:hypothetical protein